MKVSFYKALIVATTLASSMAHGATTISCTGENGADAKELQVIGTCPTGQVCESLTVSYRGLDAYEVLKTNIHQFYVEEDFVGIKASDEKGDVLVDIRYSKGGDKSKNRIWARANIEQTAEAFRNLKCTVK